MESVKTAECYEEYLHEDFADVIVGMLAKYNEDDLVELLCECEMFLQTNDIYLNQ